MKQAVVGESDMSVVDGVSEIEEGAGQYIAFTVGEQEYCVDIMAVREIRGWTKATQTPNAPREILGVVNLRGTVIPIMDMRVRFGFGRTETSHIHVVIILSLETRLIGILVDTVSDILTVTGREIQVVDSSDASTTRSGLVSKVIARADRIVSILAPDRLLSEAALDPAAQALQGAA